MARILEELYLGKLNPSEQITVDSQEYLAAKSKADAMIEQLSGLLSPEQKTQVGELVDELTAAESYMLQAYFEHGFALGLQMMQESAKLNESLRTS